MLKGVLFSTSLRGGVGFFFFAQLKTKRKGGKSQYLMSWGQRGEEEEREKEEGTDLFFYCRPSKSSSSAQAKEGGGTMTLTNWLWRKRRGEGSFFLSLSTLVSLWETKVGRLAVMKLAEGGMRKNGKNYLEGGVGMTWRSGCKKGVSPAVLKVFFLGWGQSNFLSLFWKKLDSKSYIFQHKESKYEQHWLWRMSAYRALADFETIWYVRLQFDPWCPLYPHFEVWGAQAGVGRLLQFFVFQAADFPYIYNAKS